jgi:hypothetical protein
VVFLCPPGRWPITQTTQHTNIKEQKGNREHVRNNNNNNNNNNATQIQRMCNVKTKVTLVIIQTTVTISNHPQNTSATYFQSTTSRNYSKQPYWHCTRTAGSTGVNYRTLNVGNSIICSINCNYRIVAILYNLETWFVSGL